MKAQAVIGTAFLFWTVVGCGGESTDSACSKDTDCRTGRICVEGECADPENADDDSSDDDFEDPFQTQCFSDKDCTPYGQLCDPDLHYCVECLSDAECDGANEHCSAGKCMTAKSCQTSLDCGDMVCDTEKGYCVDCLSHWDCPKGTACNNGLCQKWYHKTCEEPGWKVLFSDSPPPKANGTYGTRCEARVECADGFDCVAPWFEEFGETPELEPDFGICVVICSSLDGYMNDIGSRVFDERCPEGTMCMTDRDQRMNVIARCVPNYCQ